MNCPNCKTKIKKDDLICPNCKKLLKLKCNNCGALSTSSVCKKCGSIILNKCYKCGRLNNTSLKKCPSCGLDINASIGLKESFIEEFAALTIKITNYADIEKSFKSKNIIEKIKNNIYSLVKNLAKPLQIRVQIINDTFIIRFCKNNSFEEACKSAIDFSIFVSQTITEINQKLYELKGVSLKCQMMIQKRTIYSKPEDYQSGININVVYSSTDSTKTYSDIQVIVDSYIYQATKDHFAFESLSAIYIKNQMVMFFELMLSKIITKKQTQKKEKTDFIEIPSDVDYEPNEIEEEKLINFNDLNCSFIKIREENIIEELEKITAKEQQNVIISIKGYDRSSKLSLIKTKDIKSIFKNFEVVRFSCRQENQYCAYGLLTQIILNYKNISETDLFINDINSNKILKNNYLQNLISGNITQGKHPEDLRLEYFESFKNFFATIPFKTLFVIEDLEFADDCSLEILEYILENNSLINTNFLFSYNKDFSLHKKIYKLITQNNYYELETKQSPNKVIVKHNFAKIKNISRSFFIKKILENTKGSFLYFYLALNYLADNDIITFNHNEYQLNEEKMLVIPKDINELVQKRIMNLQTIDNAFETFAIMLLLSEFNDIETIKIFQNKELKKILQYLETQNFIEILENKKIKIKNYNLYKTNFIKCCPKEIIINLCNLILEKLATKTNSTNIITAIIFEHTKQKKEAFNQWHSLAIFAGQNGDFCAYLNCTKRFLNLVDDVIDTETNSTIENIKKNVYADIATLLYKYYPEKIITFLEKLLNCEEIKNDDNRTKEIANKLVQSCLISGTYNNALEYIGKIIERIEYGSLNPTDNNFNLNNFLINLIIIEIFFNTGRLSECINLGNELFEYINLKNIQINLENEPFSKKQIEDAIYDAIFIVDLAKIIQIKNNNKSTLTNISSLPDKLVECYKLLSILSDFIQGQHIEENLSKINPTELKYKYSLIIYEILLGFVELKKQQPEKMANHFYKAKNKAKKIKLHQVDLFCDLMIGYAYLTLNNTKKSKQIFYSVLDISSEKGLKNISYASWFFIAKTEKTDDNIAIALEIITTSLLKMEQDENISELFTILFKVLYGEIITEKEELAEHRNKALYACEQAFDCSLNNKIFTYLPQIADILLFLYDDKIKNSQEDAIVSEYKQKIDGIYNIMNQLFKSEINN